MRDFAKDKICLNPCEHELPHIDDTHPLPAEILHRAVDQRVPDYCRDDAQTQYEPDVLFTVGLMPVKPLKRREEVEATFHAHRH